MQFGNVDRISGTYFCMNMTMITLSSFLAAIVINMYIRGDRTNVVPPWLKRVKIILLYIIINTVCIHI